MTGTAGYLSQEQIGFEMLRDVEVWVQHREQGQEFRGCLETTERGSVQGRGRALPRG